MTYLRVALAALGSLLMVATALPLLPTNDWWVPIWDFPRIQVAVLIGALLLVMPFSLGRRRLRMLVFAFGLLALASQLAGICPYTPLHAPRWK